MHLTRFGFNTIVAIWLLPLLFVDIIGNTVSTGIQSDYYYYKAIFDGILMCYAVWQLFREPTAHIETAKNRKADSTDDVVAFESLSSIEYIYCAMLSGYGALNWYFLHEVNKQATGIMSMTTLIWSIVSVAVCVLSAVQFYHLKSGAIVELKRKVIQ